LLFKLTVNFHPLDSVYVIGLLVILPAGF